MITQRIILRSPRFSLAAQFDSDGEAYINVVPLENGKPNVSKERTAFSSDAAHGRSYVNAARRIGFKTHFVWSR